METIEIASERFIKVNGDSCETCKTVLLSSKQRVAMLVRNWYDPIFHEEYRHIFDEFMKNPVPLTIILGSHDGSESSEFLQKAYSAKNKKVSILFTDEMLCNHYFDWQNKVIPQYPVIGDSTMSHVRFVDTSVERKPIWYSATEYNNPEAVASIERRLNILLNHSSLRKLK
ncbi:MAG TPA: hypothetical protein PK950_01010 [Candidatus Paceibacterota bacterium]|nr:hypothetical protein [Candidatus Paceibacterota bacterium]